MVDSIFFIKGIAGSFELFAPIRKQKVTPIPRNEVNFFKTRTNRSCSLVLEGSEPTFSAQSVNNYQQIFGTSVVLRVEGILENFCQISNVQLVYEPSDDFLSGKTPPGRGVEGVCLLRPKVLASLFHSFFTRKRVLAYASQTSHVLGVLVAHFLANSPARSPPSRATSREVKIPPPTRDIPAPTFL